MKMLKNIFDDVITLVLYCSNNNAYVYCKTNPNPNHNLNPY